MSADYQCELCGENYGDGSRHTCDSKEMASLYRDLLESIEMLADMTEDLAARVSRLESRGDPHNVPGEYRGRK